MAVKINLEDTIAAVSTPMGNGGIGIVRLSGENALDILGRIFVPACGKKVSELKSHTINYGKIVEGGKVVDEALVSVMKAPKTYTRQNVAEINCHGGMRAVNAVLRACTANGARPAEPGEFTKRAFLNGRIDLAQAEAVAEIIDAKTEAGRRSALNKLGGRLSAKINSIRNDILSAEAAVEAAIEYPEHEEETQAAISAADAAKKAVFEIRELIKGADFGRIIKNGINAVIMGRPNAGKSSLLNYLLDEERAIVTDIPGTTRDVVCEQVNIGGIPVNVIDTAGIRHTEDAVEKLGVDKSLEYGENADVIFMLLDGSLELTPEDRELLEFIRGRKAVIVINKSDLGLEIKPEELNSYAPPKNIITVSVKEGKGVEELVKRLKDMFFNGDIDIGDCGEITNERNLNSLKNAEKSLLNVINTVEGGFPDDLVSMDLMGAYEALGEITGESLEEDVIDKIFSQFCLGK